MNNNFTNRIGITIIALLLSGVSALFAQSNVRVSTPEAGDPEEVCIAINPKNPLNMIAGANIDYYFYSTDGGKSWQQSRLVSPYGVWGDPVVMFDGNGTGYFGHLSNPPSGHWIDRIVIERSSDQGKTWDGGNGVGVNGARNQDKHWLVADNNPSSPWYGSIYVSWTEFDKYSSKNTADSSRILFSRTTDKGATWSSPVRISDLGGDCIDSDNTAEGAVPAVGPNGEVYICWSNRNNIYFDVSRDGGKTWGTDKVIAQQIGGWDQMVSGLQRGNGLPMTLCDPGYPGNRGGTIYVVWGDQRNGTNNLDVFTITSTDGGTTWSQIKRVNDDVTTRNQFMPAACLDPLTGDLWVVYYDRRNTSGEATEVYAAVSSDAASTFRTYRISDSPFTPSSKTFFGDYIGIAAWGGTAHPIWMRMDNNLTSVWTATVRDTAVATVRNTSTGTVSEAPVKVIPNPSQKMFNIEFQVPELGKIRLMVFNTAGALVRNLIDREYPQGTATVVWDGTDVQGRIVPRGSYLCRLIRPDGSVISVKIVKR